MFYSIYRFRLVFSSVRHQVVSDPVQVPDINTLFPITIPGELASNIGRGIDRKTDTSRQVGVRFSRRAQLLEESNNTAELARGDWGNEQRR
jgi:hypothetical protein